MAKVPLRRRKEITRQLEMRRLVIRHLASDAIVETDDGRAGKRQENRRMCRDDELCDPRRRQVMEDPKERELPLRRQRRLGFVEEIEPILETMFEQRKKRLAVRLGVKRAAAVPCERTTDFLQGGREIEEGLGAKEETGRRPLSPSQVQRTSKRMSLDVL